MRENEVIVRQSWIHPLRLNFDKRWQKLHEQLPGRNRMRTCPLRYYFDQTVYKYIVVG